MGIKFNPMDVDIVTSEKLIYFEIENLRQLISQLKEEHNHTEPNQKLILQPNQMFLSNIILDGKSLLIQVNKPYFDSARDSYLLLAIVDGIFDKDGNAYPPIEKIAVIRLDIVFKEDGCNWKDKEGDKKVFASEEILKIWWTKFLAFVQESKNKNQSSQ